MVFCNAPKIGLVILLFLFTNFNLSSSSPLENKMGDDQVDDLRAKFDELLLQLEEEKILRDHLLNQLATENAKQNERYYRLETKFEDEIRFLTNQNIKQDEEILHLKQINDGIASSKSRKVKNDELQIFASESGGGKPDDQLPKLPPSSCRQLSTIGHYLDGIYLVANPDTNKIETIYCYFGHTLSETLYGSVDVKTKSVHFFVQRFSDFNLTDSVIPFEVQRLNVGGANQVRLFKTVGTLNDGPFSHFTGWLVEEDLLLG